MPRKNPTYTAITRGTQLYYEDDVEFAKRVKASGIAPAKLLREIVKNQFAADRLKNAGYDMTNNAVIRAQMTVVEPLKNQLDATSNSIKEVAAQMNEMSGVLNQRTNNLKAQIENNHEVLIGMLLEARQQQQEMTNNLLTAMQHQLDALVEMAQREEQMGERVLKNLITLRGLVYVYLIGFRSGALKDKDFTLNAYIRGVQESAKFFFEKSAEEILAADAQNFDALSQQVANNLLTEMKRLTKAAQPPPPAQ